jgi:hypothetical protein
MRDKLKKTAEELRKLAEKHNKQKFQKCAKVMLSAAAIKCLYNKIKGA